MNINRQIRFALLLGIGLTVTGCTVHPRGERAERNLAARQGRIFRHQFKDRNIPPLPADPSADDLVRYALMSNADLEAKYWQWRSAIEQIPQAGTPGTTLAINSQTMFNRGRSTLADTTLEAQSMPSMMIPWPGKLSAAAHEALENARAAGQRFRAEQFALRARVLDAYYDYSLTAELIRLEQANNQLLNSMVTDVAASNRAGDGSQIDVLKIRNELDISRNQIAVLKAQIPARIADLNALLGRPTEAPIALPSALPPQTELALTDNDLLALAAKQNPELAALARQVKASKQGVALAKLQYYPDFWLGASSNLTGTIQSLMGMVSVPILRYEAIHAAIRQAQARLRQAQASMRQTGNDLAARLIGDIYLARDAQRQIALYEQTILPRATEVVELTRSSYESGGASLIDLLDGQRSLIDLRRFIAEVRIEQGKRVADLEAIIVSRGQEKKSE